MALLAIALMVLDRRLDTFAGIRAALSVPVAPLYYLINWPSQLFHQLSNHLHTHQGLITENQNLRNEQLLLHAQVQRLLTIESENNQLKALLRSSTKIRGKVLIAQLLAVDSDPFVNQVIIDKGKNDNIFMGQPVLDADGVMGQIVQVGKLSSRVLLVNDPHSGVPVQIARNGLRAIAVGDMYTGKLRLANIPHTVDVQKGDLLMTSGLGANYPEGYLLGKVSSITKDPALQFATIVIEPSAHLDRSREVLLVWPDKTVAKK